MAYKYLCVIMGIVEGVEGMIEPNWITENDWSYERRIYWINTLMVFDSRDWSVYPYAVSGAPDIKQWCIWCLATCDTKEEALKTFNDFMRDNNL